LAGGTMNGNINYTNNNYGISRNGVLRFGFTGVSTIISGNNTGTNNAIFFRPQGYTNTETQVTIQADGQINTPTHGNSSQWKQAYDWGDFRDYGLGTVMSNSNSPNSWSWDDIQFNSIHRGTNHGITGISDNVYGLSFKNSNAF